METYSSRNLIEINVLWFLVLYYYFSVHYTSTLCVTVLLNRQWEVKTRINAITLFNLLCNSLNVEGILPVFNTSVQMKLVGLAFMLMAILNIHFIASRKNIFSYKDQYWRVNLGGGDHQYLQQSENLGEN